MGGTRGIVFVAGLWWLAACAAPAAGGSFEKSIEGEGRGDQEVEALLNALTWYADTASGPNDEARFRPLYDIGVHLMDQAAAGHLSASATSSLRETAIPMLSEVVRGRAIVAEAELSCDLHADSALVPHIMRSAVASGPIRSWEGDADTGIDELFHATADDVHHAVLVGGDTWHLAESLAIERATQALTSLLRLRGLLLPGAAEDLRVNPNLTIAAAVSLLPPSLQPHTDVIERELRHRLRPVSASLDEHAVAQFREETVEGMTRVLAAIHETTIPIEQALDPLSGSSDTNSGRVEGACREELRKWGQMNVLLLTPTAERKLCSYGTHFSYRPAATELSEYEGDLVRSATTYLELVGAALDEDEAEDAAKLLLADNVGALAAVLVDQPEHLVGACALAAEARADAHNARFWDSVVLWGTVALGVAALATGVGALVVGGSTALLGTTLGTVAALTSFTAAIASTGGSAYLGYRGATLVRQANQNLEALLVSGGDAAAIAADRDYAHGLIIDALLGATLSVGELAGGIRFAVNALRFRGLSAPERVRELVETSAQARAQWRAFQDDMVTGRKVGAGVDDGPLFASSSLRAANPESADEVRDIVRRAMDDESDLFADVERYLGTQGGVNDTGLWQAYFKSYDNMLLWAEEYQALVSHANRVMPQSGLIVDAGAGTGNFTAFMERGAAGRQFIAFEYTPFQRQRIADKVTDPARVDVRTGSLTDVDSIAGGADGYVLNNVLYALGDRGEDAMRMIANDLNPGGVFYLNDPIEGVVSSRLPALIEELAVSAWRNGAPLTSHDIAVIAAVNSGRLVRSAGGAAPVFRSVQELHELAARLGLEVVEEGPSYYGTSYTMVLRRPD